MRKLLTVAILWILMSSAASAQGVVNAITEAKLRGVARTYTARQTYNLLGIPLCATDPPFGACTPRDICMDNSNVRVYACIVATWVAIGTGTNAGVLNNLNSTQFLRSDTDDTGTGAYTLASVSTTGSLSVGTTTTLTGSLTANNQVLVTKDILRIAPYDSNGDGTPDGNPTNRSIGTFWVNGKPDCNWIMVETPLGPACVGADVCPPECL